MESLLRYKCILLLIDLQRGAGALGGRTVSCLQTKNYLTNEGHKYKYKLAGLAPADRRANKSREEIESPGIPEHVTFT